MERLSTRIERFIRTGDGDFNALALELFRYQYELNAPYKAWIDGQSLSVAAVQSWSDIPAVPIRAFKSSALCTFPTGRAAAMFESSRTTGQIPSRHYLKELTFYETASVRSFEARASPDGAKLPFLILAPTPGDAPRSSLTWMFDTLKRRVAAAGSDYFFLRGRLDEPRLAYVLDHHIQKSNQPVMLLGTTIAFLTFFDYLTKKGISFHLPAGSRLMDTGGMKSSKREISREMFVAQVSAVLGIPEDQCVNEYGMCEMSSQFYGRGRSSFLEGPAWVRTQVIDAESGEPAQPGKIGLLRHFDLANVDSVLAVQTEDLGRAEREGFVLLGRSPGAELKGCSLGAEAWRS